MTTITIIPGASCQAQGVTFYTATEGVNAGPVLNSCTMRITPEQSGSLFNPVGTGVGEFYPASEFVAAFSTPTPFVQAVMGVNGNISYGDDQPDMVAYDAHGNPVGACGRGCYQLVDGSLYFNINALGISYIAAGMPFTGIGALTFDPPALSEPGTFWLVGLGLALMAIGLAMIRPRRRRAPHQERERALYEAIRRHDLRSRK